MTDVTIRPAQSDDEESVWPLACALATSYTPTRQRFHESFQAILRDHAATVLVAVQQERVVGYVHALAHAAFHADGSIAWIEELIVDESRRGCGIGRSLMHAAEQWAQDTAHAVYMALATRRASAFYQAIGYADSATYFKKSFR